MSIEPTSIEAKWQKKWKEARLFNIDLKKAKDPFYAMCMFPYPSGDKLHVGHWYNFAPADSFARFMRMQGKDVFTPMGFDAFGLPAENYAIKTGIHPKESIAANTKTMVEQLSRIGCMYDWEKSVNTSQPEYYKWTQWLFIQMYKNGLAYKKEANVNWCPKDQTVLANEQVNDGKCDRCGSDVVHKSLTQWFFKITDYTERLLKDLDALDWPEKTKAMQRNWMGKKEGIDITYHIDGTDETVTCFTTRPDTNFGATFIVLAPEHPFTKKVAEKNEEVKKYCETAAKKTELERQEEGRKKTGAFTGFYAINNLNGAKIPIWVSDFVLAGFGTGAVVGVPGHDKRDFQFAETFDIPVIRVVKASDNDTSDITSLDQVQEEEGVMMNSDFLDGMEIMKAKDAIMDHLEKNGWGKRVTTYRLRDWSIGRQRYWGALIPMVYDPEGKPHPVPEEHLPWILPEDVEFKPTGTAPLAQSTELKERTEKIFGKGWTPEVDTMDTFVCSSFYYLRYLADGDEKKIVDADIEKKWMPVDMYIGGAEHATMHLIYARFVMKALKDFGFVSHDEPFQRLVHQGVITNQGAKMSKSKGNVVSPDSFVDSYGSDVFRMYLMFMGPFTEGGDWSDTGIKGIERFYKRLVRAETEFVNKKLDQEDSQVLAALHRTVKKVTEDIQKLQFNTALSSIMEFLGVVESKEQMTKESGETIVKLLGPLAPHLADELWQHLGNKGFVMDQKWPEWDEKLTVSNTMVIAIQVNGKVRGDIEVASTATEQEILKLAKENENAKKFMEGKELKKEIYVKGKLVSLVVA